MNDYSRVDSDSDSDRIWQGFRQNSVQIPVGSGRIPAGILVRSGRNPSQNQLSGYLNINNKFIHLLKTYKWTLMKTFMHI